MEIFLLCVKIFFVRIIDVSLGTFRTMLTVKDKRLIASLIGFFEVLVWFLVVKEALNTNSNSIFIGISYAGGFATGTYIGLLISDKYISGLLELQIITEQYEELVKSLREQGFAVTATKVMGMDNKKDRCMLYLAISSKDYQKVNRILKKIDNKAFLMINESKYVRNGYFMKQDR